MKLTKEQKEQFNEYVISYAETFKNALLYESSDKYLKFFAERRWDAFIIDYLERRMGLEYDDIHDDKTLFNKYMKIMLPIFKDIREQLKVEHEDKEKKRLEEEKEKRIKKHKRG